MDQPILMQRKAMPCAGSLEKDMELSSKRNYRGHDSLGNC